MRRVTLQKPIGYCFGVISAIEKAKEVKKQYPNFNIYVFGELVHNSFVIEKLNELGINTIPFSKENAIEILNSFDKNDIVIFTAHGHPEIYNQVLEERGIIYFDTTCVNVKENMRLIKENLNRGVIYIGKKDHEETIASLSLGEQIVLYDIKEKLDYNKVDFDNPLVINQTTLSILELKEIHKEIKEHIPNCELSNEVCGATRIRQEQIKDIDDSYDLIVIVGSSNSSNTTKLYQTAKEYHKNKKVLQINDVTDFEKEDISNCNNVIMLSGTSAPMEIINKIKELI
jgi:4-hydroxy-3-methylbut-2-enyl diphosphate reductase